MLITELGRTIYRAVNTGKKLFLRKYISVPDGFSLRPSKSDTFIKEAEGVVPKKLQAVLDTLSRYDSEEKKFFTDLYKLGDEKFDLIMSNEYLKNGSFYFCQKPFLKAVEKLSPEQLTKTFEEIDELYKTLPKVDYGLGLIPQKPGADIIARLTILKSKNPDAYKYLLSHKDKELVSEFLSTASQRLNGEVFETLTIPQIRQITGEGSVCSLTIDKDRDLLSRGYASLSSYVESSDEFVRDAEESGILSKYLSGFKIKEPFTAFRGERDTGMFDSVILDSKLAAKTRWHVLRNFYKARKVQIHYYTGEYNTAFADKIDLLHYILGKKELTLADAMQVAKYGNDAFRREVIELIKKSQIVDTRFKSITFDRKMSETWAGMVQGSSNTGILHEMSVSRELEGLYSFVNNRQAEFVLNNNRKIMTFQDVVYNAENDTFMFKSTISPE